MAELKTKLTDADVQAFLSTLEDAKQQEDAQTLVSLFSEITGAEAKLWGSSIIGFGDSHYQYESGRQGEWFLAGFSPRKEKFALYLMNGFEQYPELLEKLGKYKTGKSCLYIKKLADVDQEILKTLITESVAQKSM